MDILPQLKHVQRFMQSISDCYLGLYMPHYLLQGRIAMCLACLGIPMIASEEIEVHRRLFPLTSVRWTELDRACELADRLMTDDAFYREVASHAQQAVEFYNVDHTRHRLQAALGEKHQTPPLTSKRPDSMMPDSFRS